MRLRLAAFDEDDLGVISTLTQDAVVKVRDMTWLATHKRFVLLMNRFAWEVASASQTFERRRAGLVVDFVTQVRSQGINLRTKDGVVELLSLHFAKTQAPSGTLTLNFAGGGTIALTVECLELRLEDTGGAWSSAHKPDHDID